VTPVCSKIKRLKNKGLAMSNKNYIIENIHRLEYFQILAKITPMKNTCLFTIFCVANCNTTTTTP